MTKTDRRWSVCSDELFRSPEYTVKAHNADVEALEAENAKLRKVVEVACGGPVSRETLGRVIDALRGYYGNEYSKGRMWDIVDALEALLPEEGDDE